MKMLRTQARASFHAPSVEIKGQIPHFARDGTNAAEATRASAARDLLGSAFTV